MAFLFWGIVAAMTLIAALILTYPLRKQYNLALIFFIGLFLVAFILYWHLGAAKKLQHYWSLKHEAVLVKAELSNIKNPQQVVDKLKSYLRLHPNSPKGWYLLGKIYLTQHEYPEALLVLQKAHRQKPDNIDYAVVFAEASFLKNERQLQPNVQNMLKRILAQHPKRVGATNVLAINAYMQKDYSLAVEYWEKILPLFPVGSQDQKMLLSMIAEAQQKITMRHRESSDSIERATPKALRGPRALDGS